MPTSNHAHRAIHSPEDRSLQVWMSSSTIALICAVVAVPILLAWLTLDNRFPWFPKLFGARQAARSLHFLLLVGYLSFLVVHVGLVVATGFVRNMNHIERGMDDQNQIGMIIGLIAIGSVVGSWAITHFIAWRFPRRVQHVHRSLAVPFLNVLNRFHPRERYTMDDISPFFWPNGKLPVSDNWKNLAENGFKDFRVKIGGLVEHLLSLSLADLKHLGRKEHISLHHCIQGWSGIAHWAGVPMSKIIELVKPGLEAKVVAFISFGVGLYGGVYYDTQTVANLPKSECLLAYEMNYEPLTEVVGQIYLYDNPLVKQPLTLGDVKHMLLGHWGTIPRQNFICVHLNRVIKKYNLDGNA